MISLIMFLYLLVATACFLCYYSTRTLKHWQHKNVKGPKPIPLFGNFKDVALRKKHMGVVYSEIYKQYPEEKVVGLFRMTSPALLIRDLDIVRQVLIKDFESFPDRSMYYSKKGFGENLFHSNIDSWKVLRKQFTSVFTSSKFKSVFHVLVDCGDKLTDHIEEITMKQPELDVHQHILKYTVGVTMTAVFGLNFDTFDENNRIFEIVDNKLRNSHFGDLEMLFPGFLMTFDLTIIAEEAIIFCHQVIEAGLNQEKYKTHLNNAMDVMKNLKEQSDTFNKQQSKIEITDDLLAAQAWILYIAGYANNALLITYAIYHLAANPDVQEKLQKEIDKVLERHGGKLTYVALKEMKYLEQVFEETLRKHPLTNGIVRSVSKDVKLEGTDVVIEKGGTVVISPYAIQNDEKYYPEPEKFDPDRFSSENVKDRHPCAYLSFGVGPRSCLGTLLAKIQFGICLSKLLCKFRFETSGNTISTIKYDPCRLLLSPQERIKLNFVPRPRL